MVIMWDVFFTVVCAILFVIAVVAPIVISSWVWLQMKAMRESTHTVVPMKGNAFEDFQKEIESIVGGRSQDLFGDMDPGELGNFERYKTDREDRSV
jgi:Tfp pilus assembly protein PilE